MKCTIELTETELRAAQTACEFYFVVKGPWKKKAQGRAAVLFSKALAAMPEPIKPKATFVAPVAAKPPAPRPKMVRKVRIKGKVK